jgi:hypothetical protein
MKQMGHSRSVFARRESDPFNRAARCPFETRRRMCLGSHSQEGYSLVSFFFSPLTNRKTHREEGMKEGGGGGRG